MSITGPAKPEGKGFINKLRDYVLSEAKTPFGKINRWLVGKLLLLAEKVHLIAKQRLNEPTDTKLSPPLSDRDISHKPPPTPPSPEEPDATFDLRGMGADRTNTELVRDRLEIRDAEEEKEVSVHFEDKKSFKTTKPVTLEVIYEIGKSLELVLMENDIPVPDTSMQFTNSSSIEEVINNLENPEGLYECLLGRGVTAERIAEYIKSKKGYNISFKTIKPVTLEVKYEDAKSGPPTLKLVLMENDIPVPGTSMLITDSLYINTIVNNLENPKGLVNILNGRGFAAKKIANYIRNKKDCNISFKPKTPVKPTSKINLTSELFNKHFPDFFERSEFRDIDPDILNLLICDSIRKFFSPLEIEHIFTARCIIVKEDEQYKWEVKIDVETSEKETEIKEMLNMLEEKKEEIASKILDLASKHDLFSGKLDKDNPAKHYGGAATQFIWHEYTSKTSETVAEMILDPLNKKDSLEDILDMITTERYKIANYLNHRFFAPSVEYAKRTEEGFGTPISGRYLTYFKRPNVLKRLDITYNDERFYIGRDVFLGKTLEEPNITIIGNIGEDSIPLSNFEFHDPISVPIFYTGNKLGTIYHTSPSEFPKILKHVDDLFQAWKNEELSREEEIEKIAEIHWWLAQACPYKRGSASIAEMLVSAMMKVKGIPFEGFSKDFQVDLEAITTPDINEYIDNFPSFLKIPA